MQRTLGADKPTICIVSHNAYGAMKGGRSGHIGGVERQTSMTAKWLAAKGYDVSIVVWDEGQPQDEVIDGVRCIKLCKAGEGIPGLRFFHPRITSLFGALERARADLYYMNCAEYYAGAIAWWCKRNNRRFIYSTAHDYDCKIDLPLPSLEKWYHKSLFRYGMRNADGRIVQTEYQRRLLEKEFGLPSVTLPMPYIDLPVAPNAEFPDSPRVVWVGRLDPQKRLEWYLDIAQAMPEMSFEIAAAGDVEGDYRTMLYTRAKSLPNVKWLGAVKRDEMPNVYRGSLCLCCTSAHEGFPNTFLEAWSLGIPLVTSFDPDQIVARGELGARCGTVEEFVTALRALWSDRRKWETASRNARAYFVEQHSLDIAMARFEKVFVETVQRVRSREESASIGSVKLEGQKTHHHG